MKQVVNVLVVDDEPNILMSLDFLMRKAGYQVFVARNGKEALEIVERQIPDVVILDIMMPEVDGYEVCQYIRRQEASKHSKVIFLSAKTKEADIQKGYEVGANLFLAKPFSTKNLLIKVKELLAEG